MANDVIDKIKEKTELDQEKIQEKVKEKMKEFSGLVSEEGALYLVAKEFGIDPLKKTKKNGLKIANVVPNMRKVTLKCRIVRIGDKRTFKKSNGEEGVVQNIILGDETGTVRMSLWNDQTELIDKLEDSPVVEIKNAYSKEDYRGNAELRLGRNTLVEKIDSSMVGKVKRRSEKGYEKVSISGVQQRGVKYEIEGELLRVFTKKPFFHVCPECKKSVSLNESNVYKCEEHGEVKPVKNLVLSTILDDGTNSIRCVFFRNVAEKLIGEEGVKDEEKLRELVGKSIGKYINVRGKSKINSFFNALEIIANSVGAVDANEKLKKHLEVR